MTLRSDVVALALIVASPLLASLAAQSPRWSDQFGQPGIRGRVFSVHASTSGPFAGQLLAGGDLDQVTGGPRADVMWLDGQRWRIVGNGAGIVGTTRAFADFNGELIVGGELVAADGQSVAGVARWDGANWSPLGGGLTLSFGTSEVFALEVFQGSLYAAGYFNGAGGVPTSGIARWDGAQWHAVGGGLDSASSAVPTGFSLHATAAGQLVVGGSFVGAGGVGAMSIAAWDGSSWSGFGSGSFGAVRSLAEYGGELIAGGDFASMGGVAASRIARWNGSSWAPLGAGLQHSSVLSQCLSLEVMQGELVAMGKFTQAGLASAYHIARWDGSSWSASGGATEGSSIAMVLASTQWGTELVVGGEFDTAGTTSPPRDIVSVNIAAFDGAAWRSLGEGLGTNAEVNELVPYRDGVVALGRFDLIGDRPGDAAAWFDGVGWQPMSGNFSHAVISGVEFQGDFIAVGEFRTLDGMQVNGVARWDGAQWNAMGNGISLLGARSAAVYQGQLYVGGYGTPKVWNGSTWQTIGGTTSGLIESMLVHNGRLYIAGQMNNWTPPNADVLVWDGATLQPVGGDFDDIVSTLAVHQGRLIAGGWFDQCAGVSCPHLAEWNGTSWVPYAGAPFATGSVEDIVVAPNGDLIVGGNLGGNNVRRYDGATWTDVASSLIGAAASLHYDPTTDHLWMGGTFHTVDGLPADNIARYEYRNRWNDVGRGDAPSTESPPTLAAQGGLFAGTDISWQLRAPNSPSEFGVFVFGQSIVPTATYGTVLLPTPDLAFGFTLDADGNFDVRVPMPVTLAPWIDLYLQALVIDLTAPGAVATSNAVMSPQY